MIPARASDPRAHRHSRATYFAADRDGAGPWHACVEALAPAAPGAHAGPLVLEAARIETEQWLIAECVAGAWLRRGCNLGEASAGALAYPDRIAVEVEHAGAGPGLSFLYLAPSHAGRSALARPPRYADGSSLHLLGWRVHPCTMQFDAGPGGLRFVGATS